MIKESGTWPAIVLLVLSLASYAPGAYANHDDCVHGVARQPALTPEASGAASELVAEAVGAVASDLETRVPAQCSDAGCSEAELQKILVESLESTVARLSDPKPSPASATTKPSRLRAYAILAGGAVIYFGGFYLVAKLVPAPANGVAMAIWGVTCAEFFRSLFSTEMEPINGLVRRGQWQTRNGFQKVHLRHHSSSDIMNIRYTNQQGRMTFLEATGRSIGNNADMRMVVSLLPAHEALIRYIRSGDRLDRESLVRILASAVHSIWLNFSGDFHADDFALSYGAKLLLADFARNHGYDNLYDLIGHEVLTVLNPNAKQLPFYETLLRSCLTPTVD